METKTFLSPQELADRYGVKLSTIYAWNHYGTGPPYLRTGNTVRYDLEDVEEWEDGHKRAGT